MLRIELPEWPHVGAHSGRRSPPEVRFGGEVRPVGKLGSTAGAAGGLNEDRSRRQGRVVGGGGKRMEEERYEGSLGNLGVGMEVAKRKVKKMVIGREDLRVVRICGIGGNGKTTLARAISRDDEDDTELNEEEEGAKDVSGSTEKEIEQGFRNLRFLREQVILLPNTNIPDAYVNGTSEEQAILEFFQKLIESISMDLQFVIDDISNEDSSAVGVTWHLGMMKKFSYLSFRSFLLINTNDSTSKQLIMGVTEWKGKPFPFSKGCSFYRLDAGNGKRQIV
ncbi:hypothetical protein U1Q18_047622 [Sarracenia purpurea var. burkii]